MPTLMGRWTCPISMRGISNKFTAAAAWCSGDFNADGSVDVSDFNAWNVHKFQSADAGHTESVPEPAGCGLLAVAVAAAVIWRRRV